MSREKLEVVDVFRTHGQHCRDAHKGHVGLEQIAVMSAVDNCRSEVLGGHILHCPKCQVSTAKRGWKLGKLNCCLLTIIMRFSPCHKLSVNWPITINQ
jgi:hypothetical protein